MAMKTSRTNYLFWAVATAGVFVVLGFVNPLAGATWKGEYSLWDHVGILLRGEHMGGAGAALVPVLFLSGVLAVPSLLVGWLVQAVFVVARAPRGSDLRAGRSSEPRNGTSA